MDRADIVHENFLQRVPARDFPQGKPPVDGLSATEAVALFRAQCLSRALDRTSRAMQKAGKGFYTIGSSGHEGMAAVAHAVRPTDMAFLHYRDAAFQIARADQDQAFLAVGDKDVTVHRVDILLAIGRVAFARWIGSDVVGAATAVA